MVTVSSCEQEGTILFVKVQDGLQSHALVYATQDQAQDINIKQHFSSILNILPCILPMEKYCLCHNSYWLQQN